MFFNLELGDNKKQKVNLNKKDDKYFISFDGEDKETLVDFVECGDFYSVIIENVPYIVNFNEDGGFKIANKVETLKVINDENQLRKNLKESYSSNVSKICSKIPGKILEVKVKENQEVKQGDVLFILEAMKMENRIYSSKSGKVKTVLVKNDDLVMTGDDLLIFE